VFFLEIMKIEFGQVAIFSTSRIPFKISDKWGLLCLQTNLKTSR
jgi:hypothetical protein